MNSQLEAVNNEYLKDLSSVSETIFILSVNAFFFLL